MTKEEYMTLLDIYLSSFEAYNSVFFSLMGNMQKVPAALGCEDGLFGKITKLEKILFKYSYYDNIDDFINVVTNDTLSLQEKMEKIL